MMGETLYICLPRPEEDFIPSDCGHYCTWSGDIGGYRALDFEIKPIDPKELWGWDDVIGDTFEKTGRQLLSSFSKPYDAYWDMVSHSPYSDITLKFLEYKSRKDEIEGLELKY